MIKRLVDQGDSAVLAALWPPEGVDWGVSHAGPTHDLRSLAITYHNGQGERRARKAWKAALGSGEATRP
jgi:hypothetical protein